MVFLSILLQVKTCKLGELTGKQDVIVNIPQAVHVAMIYYYYYYLKLGCFKNHIVFFVQVKVFITFFLGGDNPVRQTD